jgi:hypothetical protein
VPSPLFKGRRSMRIRWPEGVSGMHRSARAFLHGFEDLLGELIIGKRASNRRYSCRTLSTLATVGALHRPSGLAGEAGTKRFLEKAG